MRQPQLSIGIPAFNEADNLASLLLDISKQIRTNYSLKEILIVSDGSTDNTVEVINNSHNPLVKLIVHNKRKGKSAGMQEILDAFSGDILFFFDADIQIKDERLLAKLVKDVKWAQVGLVAINPRPLKAITMFEAIVNASCKIQEKIRQNWENGDNYLAFKGCFLGLSSSFAKSIKIADKVVNNDAYLYFAAKQKGYFPAYYPNLHVYYRSPGYFRDHIHQSSRFQNAFSELYTYFPMLTRKDFLVPFGVGFTSSLTVFVNHPLALAAYVFLIITKLMKKPGVAPLWKIAASTKEI